MLAIHLLLRYYVDLLRAYLLGDNALAAGKCTHSPGEATWAYILLGGFSNIHTLWKEDGSHPHQ
jgi:hypothetical protein